MLLQRARAFSAAGSVRAPRTVDPTAEQTKAGDKLFEVLILLNEEGTVGQGCLFDRPLQCAWWLYRQSSGARYETGPC